MQMLIKVIRGVASGIAFSVFGIGALCIGVVIFPLLGVFVKNNDKRQYFSLNIIKYSWVFFVQIMEFLQLIKVELDEKQFKGLKGCIVVANHPSLIDVVILVSVLPNPVCVIKSQIGKNIFFKDVVHNTYIKNDEPLNVFVDKCSVALAKGFNIIIFPQGTRTTENDDTPLYRGVAYVAMHTKTPIVPVHIDMSDNILGKHQRFYEVAKNKVVYKIILKNILHVTEIIDEECSLGMNARRVTAKIKQEIG